MRNPFARTACEWIQPGETVRTDGYYSFLTLVKEAYNHERVMVETPEQASVKFPWVHTVVSNCKNQLQGTQRAVSLKHLVQILVRILLPFQSPFLGTRTLRSPSHGLHPLDDRYLFGVKSITSLFF